MAIHRQHCIYFASIYSSLTHKHTRRQIMQSHLGLNQSTTATNKDGGMRKRAAPQGAPKRSGDLWVLAQPVSASAAERNWSVYGQIMTPARSRMHHARADKLEYCHKA